MELSLVHGRTIEKAASRAGISTDFQNVVRPSVADGRIMISTAFEKAMEAAVSPNMAKVYRSAMHNTIHF